MGRARAVTVSLGGIEIELRYDWNTIATLEQLAEQGLVLATPAEEPEPDEPESDGPEPDGPEAERQLRSLRRIRATNVRAAIYAMARSADEAAGRPVRFTLTGIGAVLPMPGDPELIELLAVANRLSGAAWGEEEADEGNTEAPESA